MGNAVPNPNPENPPNPSDVAEAQTELGGVITLPNIGLNPRKMPCERIKTTVNKPAIKDSITAFNSFAQTSEKKEKGVQELSNGTLLSGNADKDFVVQFGIGPNSKGTIHVHPLKGIPMFSAQDILSFIFLLRQQDGSLINSAYSGMISASGNYFISFTGSSLNLPPPMTAVEEQTYAKSISRWYQKVFHEIRRQEGVPYGGQISSKGKEKLFFDMLRLMNLEGNFKLIRENNVETSTVIENPTGGINVYSPC